MSALPPSLTRVMTHALLVTTVAALLAALPAEPAWAAVPARCDDALPIAAGGDDMTYSLGPDASLWAWGNNYFGQLGDGTSGNGNMRLTPMHLQDGSFGSLVSVSAGGDFVLALNAEGEVWSWGYNTWGELGDGTTMDRATPQKVAGLPEIKAIFAGSNTSFAIARDGTVWGWGRNERGMLGDGTTTDRLVPTQIPALTGVT